jgi:hypothetical protein
MRLASSILALECAALVAGCSATPLTQLIVVVDTDYAVPAELDTIAIGVVGPEMPEDPVRVAPAIIGLPVTLGLVHRGGVLGPITVSVEGELGGSARVRRVVRTSFVASESRVLWVDLLRACDGPICTDVETTCLAGSCGGIDVDPRRLPLYAGTIERFDAGPTMDAMADVPIDDVPGLDARDTPADVRGRDACMPTGAETCNGLDDDCDGTIDEGVCTCMPACMLDHATATCVGGVLCDISSCETGWANCDMMRETGCERSTRTLSDCNACDRPCAFPIGLATPVYGTATCADGTCRVQSCSTSGYADCNDSIADGCETNTTNSATHCGRCDNPCTTGMMRCMGGTCR